MMSNKKALHVKDIHTQIKKTNRVGKTNYPISFF